MKGISSEIIGIIYQLLPGFVVAWILYGLTAHLKPSPFERVVQALIFTVLVRSVVIIFKIVAIFVGENYYSFGNWTTDIELIWSIFLAVSIGLLLTWCVNNDFPLFLFRKDGKVRCWKWFRRFHEKLAKIKLTDKTLHPTEWYTAFNSTPSFIVLHLSGERRLYGWPNQYPDDPKNGHFIIEQAEWLLDDGSSAPLHTVKQVLINAAEVERVEILKEMSDIRVSEEELNKASEALINLYKKENSNANKCTQASSTDSNK